MIWRAAVDDWAAPQAAADERAKAGSPAAPGTILRIRPNVAVQCGRGRLVIEEVQATGRRRMGAAEFLRGRRIIAGARLG